MALKQSRFVVFRPSFNEGEESANTKKNPVAAKTPSPHLWYWHLEAKNGKLVACGGEGFKTREACLKSVQSIRVAVVGAPIIEEA